MLVKRSYPSAEITSIDRDALMARLRRIASGIADDDPDVIEVRLHGSLALNEATPDGDIDLLIIKTADPAPFLQRQDRYIDRFANLSLDIDIKVYTRSEIDGMQADENPFITDALAHSVVLATVGDGR